MNCLISKNTGMRRRITALSAAIVLGISLVGGSSLAVDFTQPPSAFDITTDGIFTGPEEWSDVIPSVRLGGESLVYTATDAGREALYLMYDLPTSTEPVPVGATAGPVHFHNDGHSFEVFFICGAGIMVLKDGILFDVTDPAGGEDSIEGACGFGPSPESATPHNMFELEVLFDGSDPTLDGHNHGQYSPDPSHWGAGLPTDPDQTEEPRCVQPNDPGCDENNDPIGGSQPNPVPCPGPGEPDEGIRISFGEEVSNACVTVVRGSGGVTLITAIPLPRETVIETDVKPGSDPNGVNPRSRGKIPVAILTTPTFDALDVDPVTVAFGPNGAAIAHLQGHVSDVDEDGDLDLLLHFRIDETGIACGDSSADLTGQTFGGQLIIGSDAIKTSGCGGP